MGEVGLSGEVRAINFAKERLQEAAKLGFKQAVIPAGNLKEVQALKNKIDIIAIKSIHEAIDFCLKK